MKLHNAALHRAYLTQTKLSNAAFSAVFRGSVNSSEAAGDVVSDRFVRQVVLDKPVKFHDPVASTVLEKLGPTPEAV